MYSSKCSTVAPSIYFSGSLAARHRPLGSSFSSLDLVHGRDRRRLNLVFVVVYFTLPMDLFTLQKRLVL
jgi:hypothetical protein